MPSPRTKAPTDETRKRIKKAPRAMRRVPEIPRSFVEEIVWRCQHGGLSSDELKKTIREFNKEHLSLDF